MAAASKNGKHPYIGKYVVVRTCTAGVHVGVLDSIDGKIAMLSDARRIWSWQGAFTLSELSRNGISGGRVSVAVPTIQVTEAIELIPASPKAEANLRAIMAHKI